MIQSSYFEPVIYPILVDAPFGQIDRLQEMSVTSTLNRKKIEEIGRYGIVNWIKAKPVVKVSLKQLEFGNMDTYRKLANKGASVSQINFSDFTTSISDVAAFQTDDNGTFLGTAYYPTLRVESFGINIGNPDSIIQRSFSLVGEDDITLENNNKYLIANRQVIATTGNNRTVTMASPSPSSDPDASGAFLFRVVKFSATQTTSFTNSVLLPSAWSYDGVSTLTIDGASTAGDVIVGYYSASSYFAGQTQFVNNNTDVGAINADACSVYLTAGNYIYRLQSVALDVNYTREDVQEIGNPNSVQFGIKDTVVKVTLGRLLEQYTIEEVLRGVAGQSFGKINVRNFGTGIQLVVKVYTDNTKRTFKMGYKVTDLGTTATSMTSPLNDYIKKDATLEGEVGLITTNEASL